MPLPMHFPAETWTEVAPDKVGVDRAGLRAALDVRMGTDKNPEAGHHGALNAMLRTLTPAISALP